MGEGLSTGDLVHPSESDFSPAVYRLTRMAIPSTALKEALCNRLLILQEASGLGMGKFAKRVGLSAPQLTNISNYRNPPSHDVIAKAVHEFGITPDWFYSGSTVGFRDTELADRMRELVDAQQRPAPRRRA